MRLFPRTAWMRSRCSPFPETTSPGRVFPSMRRGVTVPAVRPVTVKGWRYHLPVLVSEALADQIGSAGRMCGQTAHNRPARLGVPGGRICHRAAGNKVQTRGIAQRDRECLER